MCVKTLYITGYKETDFTQLSYWIFAFKKMEHSSLLIILFVKISLEMMFGDIIDIQIKFLQGI